MTALIKAARGNINTQHGEQIGRGFPHVGIDIGWGGGLELYAPAAGWLSWSWAGSYGNLAVITHDDGSRSRIAHADSYLGFNGRRVERGEHIGTMGKSGGPWGTSGWFVHCHQEYWVDGRAVDPTAYMGSSTAGEEFTPITPLAPTEPEEDDAMKPYIVSDGAAVYLCVPGRKMIHIPNPDQLAAIREMLAGGELGTLAKVRAVESIWSQIPV